MKIADANAVFNHRIVDGSEFLWNCWPNARYIDYECDWAYGSVVFSSGNGMIFEATVNWKDDQRSGGPYRWFNPSWRSQYVTEAQRRNVAVNVAWDDVKWIDVEEWDDFARKAGAMFSGEQPDERISVSIDIPDELILQLAMEAHNRDITLNQLINQVLSEQLEREMSQSTTTDESDEDEDELSDSEFRKFCLQPHVPQLDDTDDRSTSDIEHSSYWYDTDRNK